MKLFLCGAVTLGYFAIALFFLRFWRKSGDRLFAFFALAFVCLGLERPLFLWIKPVAQDAFFLYGIRLIAFGLILFAIIDKNSLNAKR